MEDRPYKVIDTEIHPKLLADWNKHDLLLWKPERHKMHRFSLTEFVWVKIIEKMRQLNFPFSAIRTFKDELMIEPLSELADELPESFIMDQLKNIDGFESNKEAVDFFNQLNVKQLLKDYLPEQANNGNLLEILITTSLFLNSPVSFLIDHLGQAIIFNPILLNEGVYDNEDIGDLFSTSFVCISLNEILSTVLVLSDLEVLHGRLMLISDQEANVIQALREGDVSSVLVRFDKEHEMDLMEIKKHKRVEREARLFELMMSHGYEDITVKTIHGKVVHCEKTRKVKLK